MFPLGKWLLRLPKKIQVILFTIFMILLGYITTMTVISEGTTAENTKNNLSDPEYTILIFLILLISPFAVKMLLEMACGYLKRIPFLRRIYQKLRLRIIISFNH